MPIQLIADSGSTKTEWCVLDGQKKRKIVTQGLSPYFLSTMQIKIILEQELLPALKGEMPQIIHFYGTGCSNLANVNTVKQALIKVIVGQTPYSFQDLHRTFYIIGHAKEKT